jgi:type IX secretion system PorP/SprF family membrane protein
MNKILQAIILFLVLVIDVKAQQDPQFTQYMYNMNVVNPAYAGTKEHLTFGALYRKQWLNIDGSPTSFTFYGEGPVGKNLGLGLSVISDKVGPVTEQNIYGDFAYKLQLGENSHLSFGIKAGATLQKVNYSEIIATLPDPSEGIFGKNTNDITLNIGSGVFYYTDRYYVSFSVPNLLKSAHLDFDGKKYGSDVSHYFLTAGYVFDLNPNLKFKPSFLLKSAFNVPTSLDASANFLYKEKIEFGATYRLEDSFGLLVNFNVTPDLRIGYAYDHIVSDLNISTSSSHEIILLYDLFPVKKVSRSPRFF